MMCAIKAVRFHNATIKQASKDSGGIVPTRTLRRYVAMSRDEPGTIFYMPATDSANKKMRPNSPKTIAQYPNTSCSSWTTIPMSRSRSCANGANGITPSTHTTTGVAGLDELLEGGPRDIGNGNGMAQGNILEGWSSGNEPPSLCRNNSIDSVPLSRSDSNISINSMFSDISVGSLLGDDMLLDDQSHSAAIDVNNQANFDHRPAPVFENSFSDGLPRSLSFDMSDISSLGSASFDLHL